MMQREVTDEIPLPPHGQGMMTDPAWSVSHPSQPIPRPREEPQARRVRRRPHRKYSDPSEMWEWHWVRMRVVLAWTMVATSCGVVGTAATVILSEFL